MNNGEAVYELFVTKSKPEFFQTSFTGFEAWEHRNYAAETPQQIWNPKGHFYNAFHVEWVT